MPTKQAQKTVSRPRVSVNRFPGKCIGCDAEIGEYDGYIHKDENDKWATECAKCAAVGRRVLPLYDHEYGDPLIVKQYSGSARIQRGLSTCTRCHTDVAWVQNKSGKWYLSDTQQGIRGKDSDGFDSGRVVGFIARAHDCDAAIERQNEMRERFRREAEEREAAAAKEKDDLMRFEAFLIDTALFNPDPRLWSFYTATFKDQVELLAECAYLTHAGSES